MAKNLGRVKPLVIVDWIAGRVVCIAQDLYRTIFKIMQALFSYIFTLDFKGAFGTQNRMEQNRTEQVCSTFGVTLVKWNRN